MTLPDWYKVLELKRESYQKCCLARVQRALRESVRKEEKKKKRFLLEMSQSSTTRATEEASKKKNACLIKKNPLKQG